MVTATVLPHVGLEALAGRHEGVEGFAEGLCIHLPPETVNFEDVCSGLTH